MTEPDYENVLMTINNWVFSHGKVTVSNDLQQGCKCGHCWELLVEGEYVDSKDNYKTKKVTLARGDIEDIAKELDLEDDKKFFEDKTHAS